ncbi:hypothetical protein D3C73_968740 [compost metagenome]
MDSQPCPLQALFQGSSVRSRRCEVSTHGHENIHVSLFQGMLGFHGVIAVIPRHVEAKLFIQCGQEGFLGFLPDAHGAVALHV